MHDSPPRDLHVIITGLCIFVYSVHCVETHCTFGGEQPVHLQVVAEFVEAAEVVADLEKKG